MDDVDFKDMRASARSAVQQFEPQGREGLLMVSRVIGGPDIRELTAKAAEADLVLVPANVAIDGSWAAIQSEVAEFLARRSHAPILRFHADHSTLEKSFSSSQTREGALSWPIGI
jgi:hypothetical protein